MFKVRDYVMLLEKHRDTVNDPQTGQMEARGFALIAAVKKMDCLQVSKMMLLPNSLLWKIMEDVMASDTFKKEVKETMKAELDAIGQDVFNNGVKSMVSGRPFVVSLKLGDRDFGLTLRNSVNWKQGFDIRNEEIEEELKPLCNRSTDLVALLNAIQTVDGKDILFSEKLSILLDMDYYEFLKILDFYDGMDARVYALDWATLLKN